MTVDGHRVLCGIFRFCETVGLPLVVVLDYLKKKGDVVDWVDYLETGFKRGMKPERLIGRVGGDIHDSYGPEYRDVVLQKIEFYMSTRDT